MSIVGDHIASERGQQPHRETYAHEHTVLHTVPDITGQKCTRIRDMAKATGATAIPSKGSVADRIAEVNVRPPHPFYPLHL